jgi:hypothetical protein
MLQNRTGLPESVRRVAGALERSRDLLAIGGGMIGLALIVGVIVIGIHERQSSFRSTSLPDYTQESPSP